MRLAHIYPEYVKNMKMRMAATKLAQKSTPAIKKKLFKEDLFANPWSLIIQIQFQIIKKSNFHSLTPPQLLFKKVMPYSWPFDIIFFNHENNLLADEAIHEI